MWNEVLREFEIFITESPEQNKLKILKEGDTTRENWNEKVCSFFFLIEMVYLSHIYYVYLFIRSALQRLWSF